MAHEFQNFKSTTLASALAAGATSATLTAANFTDFTDGYLVLDYDNPTKREVIRCTVSGTAVSSITRGQDGTSDVAHDAGAKVIWALLATHLEELTSGWKLANEAWAYASASTITVPSGAASRYSIGDKIKLTQTTVKYFYVTSVADTVLTVSGGTDYTVANAAITNNYYSKASSPVGFPQWFNYTSNGTGIATSSIIARFSISGRTVTQRCRAVISGAGSGTFSITAPIANSNTENFYGSGVLDDTGTRSYNLVSTIDPNSTAISWYAESAKLQGGVPITFANGDSIESTISYEI